MQRRHFFKQSFKAAAITAGAMQAPAVLAASKKRFRWRLVMVIPKTLPVWGTSVQRFAEQIEVMSEGQLRIKVYGAGEMVPALETFSAVSKGQVQMGHSAAYYWQGKLPAAPFFTSVPFGMNANGMRAWLKDGGGQKLWDDLYRPHGVFSLPAGNTGLQMGGWFRKPIQSLKDFKGLKMRIPGLGGKIVAAVGGQPLLIAGGEIFTNLSTGVLDATEWVGPYHDNLMGFHKVAKYYYHPGWHEPGPVLELMINQKAWDSLPPHLQQMVRAAAAQLDRDMYAEWLAKDSLYLDNMKASGKINISPYPQDVIDGLKKVAVQVKSDVAKTSTLAKAIYASYTSFQEKFNQFQKVTEWDYVRAIDS